MHAVINQYIAPVTEADQAATRAEAARLIEQAADLAPAEGAARLSAAGASVKDAARFYARALVRDGWISDDLTARTEIVREVGSRVPTHLATILDVAEAYLRIVAAERADRALSEAAGAAAAARVQPHTTPAPRGAEVCAVAEVVEACAVQLVASGLARDVTTARRELRAEVSSRAVTPTVADVVAAFARMSASLRPLTPSDLLRALKHRRPVADAA